MTFNNYFLNQDYSLYGGKPESKMKCLTLFSATARLLWQRFLLAWACRSEFDGELISVCTLPSHIFFCSDLWPPLWPPQFWINGVTLLLYLKYICFVGTSLEVRPLEKRRLTLGISQKQVTLLPNQYMGVTVYPHSHIKHISCVFTHISLIQKWGKNCLIFWNVVW